VGILTANLDVLRDSQRRVWNQLGSTPSDFVLYEGTALALRLGHRESVDFDFFSGRPFHPAALARSIPYLKDQVIAQQSENTLSCDIATETGVVKVSFFGGLSLRQIESPDLADNIAVASLSDLFGTKCATVPQRNEVKDYVDIHALLDKAKLHLIHGIACAKAIYGRQYNPMLTLQALSYFDDLREPLAPGVKSDLVAAVKSVSLQDLPAIDAAQKIGDGLRKA
jgi:hypothetical protein